MSKPVRIRDDVAARVAVVAEGERRSLANMVEVLLLASLAERGSSSGEVASSEDRVTLRAGSGFNSRASSSRSASADPDVTVPSVRPHMKKNRAAVECGSRLFVDGVCPDCGQVA